jgi:16S rRNA (guanine527-N7)-methyltransferase
LPRRNEVSVDALAKDREQALRLVSLSQTEQQRLTIYQDLLLRWQGMLNLVSATTLPHLWTRHIADSAQLRDLARAALCWADLGSGGGFPGLVIAILLADKDGAEVHLIERDKRKASFLQTVSRETGAPAIVHAAPIEGVIPTLGGTEVITSRAVAPLAELIDWSRPVLQAGATGLFLKGRTAEQEIADAADPRIDLSTLPSRTDPSGRIISVRYKGEAIR